MNHRFETINIERDLETCILFRKDSYIVSFGTEVGFESEISSYKARMIDRIKYLPQGNCHLWSGNRVIGQIETKLIEDPNIGYISFLYLVHEIRAQGFGELLHKHAISVFSELGKTELHLSVSNSNIQALSFYKKHGWLNLGPRASKNKMFLMNYLL